MNLAAPAQSSEDLPLVVALPIPLIMHLSGSMGPNLSLSYKNNLVLRIDKFSMSVCDPTQTGAAPQLDTTETSAFLRLPPLLVTELVRGTVAVIRTLQSSSCCFRTLAINPSTQGSFFLRLDSSQRSDPESK